MGIVMKKSIWGNIVCLILLVALVFAGFIGIQKLQERKQEQEKWTEIEQAKVVLYEGPKSLRDATGEDLKNTSEQGRDFSLLHCTDTTVTVNGQECYVYDTNVNHTRQWVSNYLPPQSRTPLAYFDFEGTVEVTVTAPDRLCETVSVSPLSAGIEPVVDAQAHTVTFRINTPGNYTVQFDGSPERAVHLFANAIETEVPDVDDPNVIYIGPGEWNIESIMLKSGQTLYLAGGSVVHGIVNSNFEHDIKVCGRGILDGSQLEGWQGKAAYIPLKFDHCHDITLENIIVLNSNAWACQAYDSNNGVIDGVRIITSRPNGDGISLQSCQNYEVKNCFVRSWDDSLVVKNYDQNSTDIAFHDTQIWTDFAQSMEVGYETNKGKQPDAVIERVSFENITVLNNFHKPVISVHNGDDAAINGITFRNVTVEHEEVGSGDADEMPYLIDINIMQSGNWSTTLERGTIANVTIDGFHVLSGKEAASRIQGYDEAHRVSNVTISDFDLLGKAVKDETTGKFEIDDATTSQIVIE